MANNLAVILVRDSLHAPAGVTVKVDLDNTTFDNLTDVRRARYEYDFGDTLAPYDITDPLPDVNGVVGQRVPAATSGVGTGCTYVYREPSTTLGGGVYVCTVTARVWSPSLGAFESFVEQVPITVLDGGFTTTHYFDSAAAPGGNGTEALPYNSLSSMPNLTGSAASNYRARLKRGSTFVQTNEKNINRSNNILIDDYGTGAKPIIQNNSAFNTFNVNAAPYGIAGGTDTTQVRFIGLAFTGSAKPIDILEDNVTGGAGTRRIKDVTMMGCTWEKPPGIATGSRTLGGENWRALDGIYIHDCAMVNVDSASAALFTYGVRHLGVRGYSMRFAGAVDGTSHGIWTFSCRDAFYERCSVAMIDDDVGVGTNLARTRSETVDGINATVRNAYYYRCNFDAARCQTGFTTGGDENMLDALATDVILDACMIRNAGGYRGSLTSIPPTAAYISLAVWGDRHGNALLVRNSLLVGNTPNEWPAAFRSQVGVVNIASTQRNPVDVVTRYDGCTMLLEGDTTSHADDAVVNIAPVSGSSVPHNTIGGRGNLIASNQRDGSTNEALVAVAQLSDWTNTVNKDWNENGYVSAHSPGAPRFKIGGVFTTLAEWRAATGADADSVVIDDVSHLLHVGEGVYVPVASAKARTVTPLSELYADFFGAERTIVNGKMLLGAVDPEASAGGGVQDLGDVSILNTVDSDREDVVTIGLPVPQGVLTATSQRLKVTGAGGSEHVQWTPDVLPAIAYSAGNVSDAMRPRTWPDGSFKVIKASFPVSLAAAPNPAGQVYTERIATLSVAAGTAPSAFTIHADVLAGLQSMLWVLSVGFAGGAREEITLRWADAQLIEGGNAGDHYGLWRIFGRLGNQQAGDHSPVYLELILRIANGLAHVKTWFRWGNSQIEYGTGRLGGRWPGNLVGSGTQSDPYRGLRFDLEGPTYLTVRGTDTYFADFVIRRHGDKVDRKQTQGSQEVTHFLLEASSRPTHERLPFGISHQYEGVILFGASSATQVAEASNATMAMSQAWIDSMPPYYVTAPYPPWIANRAEGVRRLCLMANADAGGDINGAGTKANPYHPPQYGQSPKSSDTGDQGRAFGIVKAWPDIRTGYPIRNNLVLASTRQWGCAANWHVEQDGRPFRTTHPDVGRFVARWIGGLHTSSRDFLGMRWSTPPINETMPTPADLPTTRDPSSPTTPWHGPDDEHWSRVWETQIAFITCDWWALHLAQMEAQYWIGMRRVDNENLVLAGTGVERAQGRDLGRAVELYALTGDAELKLQMDLKAAQQYTAFLGDDPLFGGAAGVGTMCKPLGIHTRTAQTALYTRGHAVLWETAIAIGRGLWTYYRENRGTTVGEKAGRMAREIAAWMTLEGYLDLNASRKIVIVNDTLHVGNWNDAALAGRTATGATSGATGVLLCCFRGGATLHLKSCTGTFLPNERIDLSGAGGYSTTVIREIPAGVRAVSLYACGIQKGSQGGRFLTLSEKEETYQDTSGQQESGWVFRNIYYINFYDDDDIVAACIGKWAADQSLYPPQVNAIIKARAEYLIALALAGSLVGRYDDGLWGPAVPSHMDEWLSVTPGNFGGQPQEPPSPPDQHTLTGTSRTELLARWRNTSPIQTGLEIQLSVDGENGPWLPSVFLGPTLSQHPFSGLSTSTQYWSRVRATSTVTAPSAWSAVATGTTLGFPMPNAPGNFAGAAVAPIRMRLSWDDTNLDPNEDGTIVERSANGTSGWTERADVGADEIEAFDVDENLLPDTVYYYRARTHIGRTSFSAYTPVIAVRTQPASGGGTPPGSPSSLTVNTPSATVGLFAWARNAPLTEEGFEIQASVDGGTTYRTLGIAAAGATTAQLNNLMPNTAYKFRVRAFLGDLLSGFSNVIDLTTPSDPQPIELTDPESLDAPIVGSGSVRLIWVHDGVGTPTSFELQRRNVDDGEDWQTLDLSIAGADRTVDDRTVSPLTEYDYRIRAANAFGVSGWSNVLNLTTPDVIEPDPTPAAPSGLGATGGAGKVDLAWTDNATNETGFEGQYSADGGAAWTLLFEREANTVSFMHVVPASLIGVQLAYRVRATAPGVVSAWSNIAFGTASAAGGGSAPATPTGLAGVVGDDSVALSWDNVTGEDRFILERSDDGGLTYFVRATPAANVLSVTDGGLAPLTTYKYRISAANGALVSAPSAAITVTTTGGSGGTVRPAQPTRLDARADNRRKRIVLRWRLGSNNETGVRVELFATDATASGWSVLAMLGKKVERWVDVAPPVGVARIYRVVAFNAAGDSEPSVPDGAALAVEVPTTFPVNRTVSFEVEVHR